MIYSSDARTKIGAMIREFCPDVAHVRNIYHHLTPSILWELRAECVPVLYHLNDFKLLCPSYNMVSQGRACERCKGGAFWHALSSSCYPGMGARIALTAEAYAHRWVRPIRSASTSSSRPAGSSGISSWSMDGMPIAFANCRIFSGRMTLSQFHPAMRHFFTVAAYPGRRV